MLFKRYLSERDNAAAEIRFLRWLVLLLAILILVQLVLAARVIGSERVVIVPPEIKRSFWVSGNAVSPEYLEEMAFWYAGLALNVTPSSSDYQSGLFLKFADPSEYGRLQAEMGTRTEFIKKNNVSTHFAVRTITADADRLRIALHGTLVTWTSDKKAGERATVFVIGFRHMNGRLYVSEFKETSEQDPFGFGVSGGNR